MRERAMMLLVVVVLLSLGLITVSPSQSVDDRELAKALLFLRGTEHHNQGRYEDCVKAFQEYESLDPLVDWAYTNQAVCWEKQGKKVQAVLAYSKCLSVLTDNLSCLNAFCNLYLIYGGTPEEENATCGRAYQVHPGNSQVLHNWGVVHVNRFQYSTAISLLHTAWNLNTADSSILSNLCNALSRGGYCEWCMGNISTLLNLSQKSSVYSSNSIFRSCCYPNDEPSIKSKWTSLKKWVEEVNDKIKQLAQSADPSDASKLCQWKMILHHQQKVQVKLHQDEVYQGTVQYIPKGVDPPIDQLLNLRYEEKVVSVMKFDGVYMEGDSGILYHDHPICQVYINDHLWSTRLLEDWTGLPYPIQIVSHPVASPIQFNMRNHYHLMVETLSRIIFLRKYILSQFPEVKLLLPFTDDYKPQMQQIVDILKIKKDEYIEYLPSKGTRTYFPSVWTVDWRAKDIDSLIDPWSVFFPPRSILHITRSTILSILAPHLSPTSLPSNLPSSPSPSPSWTILYITRNDTGVRKVINEHLLINALHSNFPDHVTIFEGKSLPILTQIQLFHHSKIIISPHGAALANLLWTSPDTSLIQFPLHPHVDTCFAHLATALSLDYWLAHRISAYYYGDFQIDQEKVNEVVEVVWHLLKKKGFLLKQDL